MEIFVQNLPLNLNLRKVGRGISIAVKKSFQQEVDFDWQRFKRKGSGRLTFPTLEIGQEFLNSNRDGFKLRSCNGEYRTIRVSPSKHAPNVRLVEDLQRRSMTQFRKVANGVNNRVYDSKVFSGAYGCREGNSVIVDPLYEMAA